MRSVFIGTSGWNYDHWQHFYTGVKRKDRLRHYARQYNAVEINSTFYRLQSQRTFERWREETPHSFRFSIKGNKFVTHNKKLLDPDNSIKLEHKTALGLGNKLSVVLWQLPAGFHKHIDRLRVFAQALESWGSVRHVVEFRHPSWFDGEVSDCLSAFGIANCLSDAASWPMWEAVTTDLVYVRLHGRTRTYCSSYSKTSLIKWASAIDQWRRSGKTVHVYFDNDAEGAAPRDAKRLMETLAAAAT